MATNFVIVDGSSLIHREYYASLPEELRGLKQEEDRKKEYWRLNRIDGHYLNAIDGFLAELIGLKYFQKADYLAVCFDAGRDSTFRRGLFPQYKAQRPPAPAPLTDQLNHAAEICKELGIPVFMSPEYEADDYAGSIAARFKAVEDIHISLMTTDRDYFQLVGGNTDVFWMCNNRTKYDKAVQEYGRKGAPIGCIRCDKYTVKQETGVYPDQIADWKGMAGDASDNIPGIKGISDKTAVPLLNRYGHLEKILELAETTDEGELKQAWKTAFGFHRSPVAAIRAGAGDARFYKELATIKTDIDVPKDLQHYNYCPDLDLVLDISDRLGLVKPVDLLIKVAQGKEALEEKRPEPPAPLKKETVPATAEEELEDDFYAFGDY